MAVSSKLLNYQQEWLSDDSKIKIIEKSRRIGISFVTALGAFLDGVSGTDTWYLGYDEKMCKEFIADVGKWADMYEMLRGRARFVETQIANQVRFKSGARCTALSSNPRTLRGKKGSIVIDEAAFHDDLDGLMKAAIAITMWGGKVSVISTHFGVNNPFYHLCESIKRGERDYSLHTVTLDDALDDGLYERICEMTGVEVEPGGKESWRKQLFDDYGDFADEELLCIPSKSGSSYFSQELCIKASDANCEVYQHDVGDGAIADSDAAYAARAAQIVSAIYDRTLHGCAIGVDFGRSQDITSIAIAWVEKPRFGQLVFAVRDIIELYNAPHRLQEEVLHALHRQLHGVCGIAIDGTGNGSYLAEQMVRTYGDFAIDVKITAKWYSQWLGTLKSDMESGRFIIPRNKEILGDFGMVKLERGVPRVGSSRTSKIDAATGRVKSRHGDSVVSIALANQVISSRYVASTNVMTFPSRHDSNTYDIEVTKGAFF